MKISFFLIFDSRFTIYDLRILNMSKKSYIKDKLGEILIKFGIITKEQLLQILEEQKKDNEKLGKKLIDKGLITKEILYTLLSKQWGVSYINLWEHDKIAPDVLGKVPEKIARHHMLVPIDMDDKTLTVAMTNPENLLAKEDLEVITGKKIKVVITSEEEIIKAIDRFYGGEAGVENIVKETENDGGGSDFSVVEEIDFPKDALLMKDLDHDVPVIRIINLLLTRAVKAHASDVHIEPYSKVIRVRYRIDGVLHEVNELPKRIQKQIISRVKIMGNLNIVEKRIPQDGRVKVKVAGKEIDLRISICPTSYGEKAVMRILDLSLLCLDLTQLGFDEKLLQIYEKNIKVPHGIILDTGPTGSGKTTTLYSTLAKLNYPDRNIVTIEDPIEYQLDGINQVQIKEDIGFTFAKGLRSFLRQDPDVIMVGEIRDAETAKIAINAALTGHLVFSTLHTNDATGAMTRLNNMGIEPFLTTSTVIMVVAQRLMRLLCNKCKEKYTVDADFLFDLGTKENTVEKYLKNSEISLYRKGGCDVCSNTGYKGRAACFEVMELTENIEKLVLNRESAYNIRKAAIDNGMQTLRQSALNKLLNGLTTIEEVLRISAADHRL